MTEEEIAAIADFLGDDCDLPPEPSNPQPPDLATSVPLSTNLAWQADTGSFRLLAGTGSEGPNSFSLVELQTDPVAEVLETIAAGADVVLLSDGGAARGRYDLLRLLDTIAFMKALRTFTQRYVWLNPLPEHYWENTTAAQIARHVPMFPLTRDGLHRAVNVLHGKPYSVERPF